jgi:hypothetical protein
MCRMTDTSKRLLDAVPVLRSSDGPGSRDFYTDVLSYGIVEDGGKPPRFGIFHGDGSLVYIDAWQRGPVGEQKGWHREHSG